MAAEPTQGFAFLRRKTRSADLQLAEIIASIVRSERLMREFPNECQEVVEMLDWSTEDDSPSSSSQ